MSSLRLHGVSKRFGSNAVLDGVDLDVPDGEFLVLLGPSGCGKTTLLRIIAGLMTPSSGRVEIDDDDVTEVAPRRRDVAMVFQSYALYPHLSVARNLGFGLSVRRVPRQEIDRRVREVADQLGLEGLLSRRPRELSGGQRQRVAVGRAMVREPRIFLMDEPLSNLDAQLRQATRLELSELHRQLGTTFVYVTHDQVEAMTMGTRIALLNGGHLEQYGTPEEIYDEPASTFVAGFMGAPSMNLLPARLSCGGGRIHAVAEQLDVPLWDAELDDREVVFGVRPEHLRIAAAGETPMLHATVLSIENLGNEEIATLQCGASRIAIRGARPLGLRPQHPIGLVLDPERAHLFSRESGRRLLWVDEPAEQQPVTCERVA